MAPTLLGEQTTLRLCDDRRGGSSRNVQPLTQWRCGGMPNCTYPRERQGRCAARVAQACSAAQFTMDTSINSEQSFRESHIQVTPRSDLAARLPAARPAPPPPCCQPRLPPPPRRRRRQAQHQQRKAHALKVHHCTGRQGEVGGDLGGCGGASVAFKQLAARWAPAHPHRRRSRPPGLNTTASQALTSSSHQSLSYIDDSPRNVRGYT